jgi:DNA polymerase III epsilon subunit family exonuclease
VIPDWLASSTRVVILDLETTGLDPLSDSILEVAAVRLDGDMEVARLETLVNPGPGVVVSPSSHAVHGIDAAMVAGAPSTDVVIANLLAFVGDDPIVAHHAPFDMAFLNRAAVMTGQRAFNGPVIDTLEVARTIFPEQRSHKLEALCQLLGHPAERFHRAGDDAAHLAALYPMLRTRWCSYQAWQEAQFRCIDHVAARYDQVSRLQDALQLEAAQLRRTLTRYLERHPGAPLQLGDGSCLTLQARERWEYDVAAVSPLLAAWGLQDRLMKLDRQRLDRWLADGRLSAGQRHALEAARQPLSPSLRLVRQPHAEVVPAQEESAAAGGEP